MAGLRKLTTILFIVIFSSSNAFALENLDELETRVARKSTNTFYSGENPSNYYIWQPETVIYVDTTSGHEVTIITSTDNVLVSPAKEYVNQPWSADGKRFMYLMNKASGSFTPGAGYWEYPWYIMRSDASYLRPQYEASCRVGMTLSSFEPGWSAVEPDIFYRVGANVSGQSGLDENGIYKHTVTDTAISREIWVDVIGGDTSTNLYHNKDSLTADGALIFVSSDLGAGTAYIVRLLPSGSKGLELSYSMDIGQDTYWGDTPADASDWHDEMFVGNADGYWLYHLVSSTWWRTRPWGTDSGTPNHTSDTSDPYDWWEGTEAQKEVQVLNAQTGTVPVFAGNYWSHGSPDRWSTHMCYSDTPGAYVAPGIWDVENSHRSAFGSSAFGGCQYHAWTGWTDFIFSTVGNPAVNAGILKWDSGESSPIQYTTAYLHSSTASEFTKPGQSPDGTKGVMRSDWLSSDSDIYQIVNYYPHPPEITSVAASGGTVTATFEWMLDSTPRGYTQRGWPDESTDDPPPPRETRLFRLWRSSDKSTWTPLGAVDANVFSRYDFTDGSWDGLDYWQITDSPGNGVWYYIVTSVEWSGLESHALSNIYAITISSGSGTGAQDTAYTSYPGDLDNISASDIRTSFGTSDTSIIRSYNIYAADGGAPSIQQQDLIATIPKDYCSGGSCHWVDWLGNTGGTTQYVVAAVDTQLNVSGSTFVTSQAYEHCGSDDCSEITPEPTANGQYHLSWDDMYEAYSGGGSPGTGQAIGVGTGQMIGGGSGGAYRAP